MGCGASTHDRSHIAMPMKPPEIDPHLTAQDLVQVMRSYPQLAGLQEEACMALGNRAVDENFAKTLVAERGVEDILTAMRNHANHQGVQGQACAALYSLAENADVRFQLSAAGGVNDMLAAMRNFAGFTAVQHRCLAALSTIAIDPDGANQIVENGGVTDIVEAMTSHPDHAGLQEAACFAICSITGHKDRKFVIRFGGLGAIPAIIAAIQNHQPDVAGPQLGVQVKACLALFNLAQDEDNTASIVKSGGAAAVLGAMRRYREEVLVQQAGCAVLQNLLWRSTANRRAIAELGAVGDILAAMRGHTCVATVQVHAAQALQNMADASGEEEEGGRGAGLSGAEGGEAVRQLVEAMRALPESVAVQRSASAALANLMSSAERVAELEAAGGLELVLGLLREAGEASVLLGGCLVVANAADFADGQRSVGRRGGVAAVLEAMRRQAGHAGVQQVACRALYQLSCDDDNEAAIASEGGVKDVVAAMQRHPEDAAVQEQACGVLSNLATSDVERQATIKAAGGTEAVAKAVSASGSTNKCQHWGQLLLDKLP